MNQERHYRAILPEALLVDGGGWRVVHLGWLELGRRTWFGTPYMLQHTATHCNTLHNTLQHTTQHCNTLQPTATHCSTPQHTTTHYTTLQHAATHCNTLKHTATHHNTLHNTATHCTTLQHTTTHHNTQHNTATHHNTLQHTWTFLRHDATGHISKTWHKTRLLKYPITESRCIWRQPCPESRNITSRGYQQKHANLKAPVLHGLGEFRL